MAEIVRIAVTGGTGPLKWPQRCPRCGTSNDLMYHDGRVARESVSLGLGFWRFRRESVTLSILMCRRHALANEIGMKLLERGMVMMALRGLIYISLSLSLICAFQFATGQRRPMEFVHSAPAAFLAYMAAGWVGAWALLWARRVSAVRTLRLDSDQDVAVLRFADQQYARDFKKANSKATSKVLTDPPAFFARPSFWKVVFVLGLVAFIAHKVAHAAH